MADKVNDAAGKYGTAASNDVSKFIESAIDHKIAEINAANERRLELFKAETEKYEYGVKEHMNNRPSKSLLGDGAAVREWNEKRIELQGRLDVNRFQLRSMEKELSVNKESVTRLARHQVSQEHPEQYRLYQDAKVKARLDMLVGKFENASNKLDNLIQDGAPDKDIYSAATAVDRAITFVEKVKGAESHIGDKLKNQLQDKKALAKEIQSNTKSRGHELE